MSPLILVILLWTSGRGTWIIGHLILICIHESTTANAPLVMIHEWCALPTKRALVTHLPYTLPRYMLLDLPHEVICSAARFRLSAHTLRIETGTWIHNTSPTCDLCNAYDVQDEARCSGAHVFVSRLTHLRTFKVWHGISPNMTASSEHAAIPMLAAAHRIRGVVRDTALCDRLLPLG